ncbi:MAG: hypothetical protein AB1411_16475 [Nitrospirota bacterium]
MPPKDLSKERIRELHETAVEHRIERARDGLFRVEKDLLRYIEKYGTGTLMMIEESAAAGLPPPDFEPRDSEFRAVVWRDWLTEEVLARMDLNARQRGAVARVKTTGRISNAEYQRLAKVPKKTATRDFDDLVAKRVLVRVGTTGRGTHYVLAGKRDVKGDRKGTSPARPGERLGTGSARTTRRRGRNQP